jgi:hypothetical protein
MRISVAKAVIVASVQGISTLVAQHMPENGH